MYNCFFNTISIKKLKPFLFRSWKLFWSHGSKKCYGRRNHYVRFSSYHVLCWIHLRMCRILLCFKGKTIFCSLNYVMFLAKGCTIFSIPTKASEYTTYWSRQILRHLHTFNSLVCMSTLPFQFSRVSKFLIGTHPETSIESNNWIWYIVQ